jgi:hypothetical protein
MARLTHGGSRGSSMPRQISWLDLALKLECLLLVFIATASYGGHPQEAREKYFLPGGSFVCGAFGSTEKPGERYVLIRPRSNPNGIYAWLTVRGIPGWNYAWAEWGEEMSSIVPDGTGLRERFGRIRQIVERHMAWGTAEICSRSDLPEPEYVRERSPGRRPGLSQFYVLCRS